jgi:PhnB protein
MPTISPYLIFGGNTEQAFNFYKEVFGGDFLNVQRFKNMPEDSNLSPTQKEKLMHIALPISKANTLMGGDALESMGNVSPGTNFQLCVEADSKEEADKIFNGLSVGGKNTMPLSDTFWGSYFGMLTDKFGIEWMVSYSYPQD